MEGKYYVFFTNFNYFYQDGFSKIECAREYAKKVDFEYSIYIRQDDMWVFVE